MFMRQTQWYTVTDNNSSCFGEEIITRLIALTTPHETKMFRTPAACRTLVRLRHRGKDEGNSHCILHGRLAGAALGCATVWISK